MYTALTTICSKIWQKIIAGKEAGLRAGRSTTEVFNLRILCEKYLQHEQDLYRVFIDFKKAFDRVWHAALWATVKKYNISANLVLCFLAPGHPPGARIQIDEIQAVKLLGLGQAVVLPSEFGIHPDNEVGSTAQNVSLRDPSTLPLQRQLFNLMWKYTVVLVLLLLRLTGLNIAVIAAEGTQVCFLYFPLEGIFAFGIKIVVFLSLYQCVLFVLVGLWSSL